MHNSRSNGDAATVGFLLFLSSLSLLFSHKTSVDFWIHYISASTHVAGLNVLPFFPPPHPLHQEQTTKAWNKTSVISTVLFVKLNLGLYTNTDTRAHTHGHKYALTQMHHTLTGANSHSTETHWRTIFFWTDVVARSKGQKRKEKKRRQRKKQQKKRLQVAIECLDLSRSLQPEQVRPPLLVQLAYNAFQCMQDCARGILFNDRLIYILMINAR